MVGSDKEILMTCCNVYLSSLTGVGCNLFLKLSCALFLPFPCPQVYLQSQDMSCSDNCLLCEPCQPCLRCGPTSLASSCSEHCVRQCQSSTVVLEPPTVVVIFPGPILTSFPQNSAVGSSTSAAVGSILSCDGVPINSGCCDLSCITSCYRGRRCPPC